MNSCNFTNKINSHTPKVEIQHKTCHFGRYVPSLRTPTYFRLSLDFRRRQATAGSTSAFAGYYVPGESEASILCKNLRRYRLTGVECSYGKIFIPVTEMPVAKTEISVTGPARLLLWTHEMFTTERVRGEISETEPDQRTRLIPRIVRSHSAITMYSFKMLYWIKPVAAK